MAVGWAAFAAAEPVPLHAVVLIYHHIASDTPPSTSVGPELFAEHLAYLERAGHQVRPLTAIVDSLRSGGLLADLTVGLSFDDGYRSVYDEAFPRLRARNWPFTVFVCPEAIDARHAAVVTWDQLREMAAAGATIAVHGLHHEFLQRRRPGEDDADWGTRIRAELTAARARITAEIGTCPPLLAYPYGEYDPALQDLVAELGWTAFGQQSGALGPDSEFTLLPRFPMAGDFASMKSLPDKLLSLPWPIAAVEPASPLLDWPADEAALRPVLTVTLRAPGPDLALPQAFASGQGAADVVWVDRDAGRFAVTARSALGPGRSRYNVTAPSGVSGRYYWYSQLWIIGTTHGY